MTKPISCPVCGSPTIVRRDRYTTRRLDSCPQGHWSHDMRGVAPMYHAYIVGGESFCWRTDLEPEIVAERLDQMNAAVEALKRRLTQEPHP